MTVRIVPLPGDRILEAGLDLAEAAVEALVGAGQALVDGDVLVVASKLVGLAEGELVALEDDDDPHGARRSLARREAHRIVADHPRVLVVQTHHGLVCANAGVDTSNVPPGHALLLPRDPDDSARRLRDALLARTGAAAGVVVTDTFGRPWREGQVDVAIGAAGVRVLRDERRGHDLWQRPLEVTVAATGDEIAAAADLVRGKDTRVGFVLVRGLDVAGPGAAADLVRDPGEDLFPAGGPTMADHVVARGRALPTTAGDDVRDQLATMLELAGDAPVRATVTEVARDPGRPRDPAAAGDEVVLHVDLEVDGGDPELLVALGGVLARLEVVAVARGWTVLVEPVEHHRLRVVLDPAGPAGRGR